MVDMSAAFDMAQHDLLLKKMALYGFSDNVLNLLESYMSQREQAVCINGKLSKLLPVETGVPQGSILGPILYTLFTNELPAILDNMHEGNSTICCYADDATLSCKSSNHNDLSNVLSQSYDKISEFMVNNRLKLNNDKSHLMVMTSSQARSKTQSANLVAIKTSTKNIQPSQKEKLLGCWVQENLKWTYNIMESEAKF